MRRIESTKEFAPGKYYLRKDGVLYIKECKDLDQATCVFWTFVNKRPINGTGFLLSNWFENDALYRISKEQGKMLLDLVSKSIS